MAIFATGPIVGSISGNVGGVNFANPSGSKVARKARRPSRTRTARQLISQSYTTIIANAWNELTADEQTAWRVAAAQKPASNRLGVSRLLSGWQEYTRVARFNLDDGDPIPTLPAISPTPPTVTLVTFTSSVATGQLISFDAPGVGIKVRGYVYANALFRTTIPKFNRDWKLVSHEADTNPSSFDITTPYQAIFGAPVLGQAIAFKWLPASTTDLLPHNLTQTIILTAA